MKNNDHRLYEFRIKYNAHSDHSAMDNFHYYMAENAEDAARFHEYALAHKNFCAQNISIERKNPWTSKWEKQDYKF